MQYTGSAYFVRRPRRLEELLVPHLPENGRYVGWAAYRQGE